MRNFIVLPIFCLAIMSISTGALRGQEKATFEGLSLDPYAYWNGISASYGDYTTMQEDSIFLFRNQFSRNDYGFGLYDSWFGFAYSRMKDDTTSGIDNQYSAIAAGGAFGSEKYGVFSLLEGKDTIWLSEPAALDSVFITNGTYPYISMRDGDMFARKFGGETGDDPDWFLLSLVGILGGAITDTVEFYLADYRDSNNENDYIIDDWMKVDLSPLDSVDMIEVSLSSSDVGDFGMNTPAYFCMDNLCSADFEGFSFTSGDYWNGNTALHGSYSTSFTSGGFSFSNQYSIGDYGYGTMESWSHFAYSNMQDSLTPGFMNQYSAFPALGANGSYNYALCSNIFGKDTLRLASSAEISGFFCTNGTYAAISMRDGDMFAKKFGGESGDDPDWFLLTITGMLDGTITGTVEFYLADYRFEDNEEDYIVSDWEWVDLTSLGTVDALEFSLSSSDTGSYGINTPAYFFLDDFNDQSPFVVNPIADIVVDDTETNTVMDVSSVFSDPDDEDAQIALSVSSNSNEGVLSTAIDGNELTLSYTQTTGQADIVIEALSNGQSISDNFSVTVEPQTGTDELYLIQCRVYPNPTRGLLRINMGQNVTGRMELFNLYGQCIYRDVFYAEEYEANLSQLDAGIYLLRIRTAESSHSEMVEIY